MSSHMYQETKKTIFISDSSMSLLLCLRILLEDMGLRIIPLKSGSVDATVAVEYRKHGFCGVLPKPITLHAFAEERRALLEAKTC